MGAFDGVQERSCRLRQGLSFPFGLFKSSVSETQGMVISLHQVSTNASACTGVSPWTHGAVGVDILLWAKCLLRKHVVLSLILA